MKKIMIIFLLSIFILFTGCGSGGSSTPDEENSTIISEEEQPSLTGVFIDSKVEGLGYRTTSNIEGKTNENGEFTYHEGDEIKFFIGDLNLGEVKTNSLISVLELEYGSNVALLLQVLDSDGNPNNGITITDDDYNKLLNQEPVSNKVLQSKKIDTSFTVSDIDYESEAFLTLFEQTMGKEFDLDTSHAEKHAINSLSYELAQNLSPILLDSLSDKDVFTGIDDILSLDMNPNDYQITNTQRLNSYFFFEETLEFVNSDIEIQDNIINSIEITKEKIEKDSEKFLKLATGAISLIGLSKGTAKDIKDLKDLKNITNNNEFLIETTNFAISKIAIDRAGKKYISNSIEETTILSRAMKDCYVISTPTVADLSQCVARVTGEAAKQLSGAYAEYLKLEPLKKRNAFMIAREYLRIYYLFGGNNKAVGQYFDKLATSNGYETAIYNANSFNQLTDLQAISDLINTNIFGNTFFENFYIEDIKASIEKYQNHIKIVTRNFINEFDNDILQVYERNYLDVKLHLQPADSFNSHKVCININNISSTPLKSVTGSITYYIDEEESTSIIALDGLGSVTNKFHQECISIDDSKLLYSEGLIKSEYKVNFFPSRAAGIEERTQEGTKYFKYEKEYIDEELLTPTIIINSPMFAKSGENVNFDASMTLSNDVNDSFTYKWEHLTEDKVQIQLNNSDNQIVDFIIPEIPDDKRHLILNFNLLVTSEKTDLSSEKSISLIIKRAENCREDGIGCTECTEAQEKLYYESPDTGWYCFNKTIILEDPNTETDEPIPATTVIRSISPIQAIQGESTVFTVEGTDLPDTISMSLEGDISCNPPHAVTDTSAKISCIPNTIGDVRFYVADKSGGDAISGSENLKINIIEKEDNTPLAKSFNLVMKTNQVKCFDWDTNSEEVCTEEHKGQDGYYQKGVTLAQERITGTDIVLDNSTQLMWSDNSDAAYKYLSWDDANEYCRDLDLNNYDDWLLPSSKELLSTRDYGSRDKMKSSKFTNIGDTYWSRDGYTGNSDKAWNIAFGNSNSSQQTKSNALLTRCVRYVD